MNKLKYFLFLFIIFMSPKVFAQEVNVTSNCYGTTGYSGMYNGHEVQYQTDSLYNFGTTYEKQLSSFETQLRYNLSANTNYTITFNTNNTQDFRNNFKTYNVYDNNNNDNNLVTGFTFVSMKKVQITFKTTSATNRVTIQMGGSNNYDSITGVNNWNIKSAILTVPDTAPSGSTNQDVINNATNNTNNIINNNNENTNNIINNNNQNTQSIIDSTLVCKTYSLDTSGTLYDGYLGSTGIFYEQTGNYNKTTEFIPITSDNRIFLVQASSTNKRVCFYDIFRVNTGCYTTNQISDGTELNIPLNTSYFRINFEVAEKTPVVNVCSNGNQAVSDSIDKVNDSINNDNVDNGVGTGFFDNFEDNDYGLSDIITIPLNTIQSLTTKTCVPLQVPIPFTNSNLTLPCMTEIYTTKFPTIYNLWKIVSFGIISYFIAIDIFHIVKGFKDPESDKVEVLDL